MDAKQYLEQLQILNNIINSKLTQLDNLESLVFSTTKALSNTKVQSSNQNSTELHIVEYIDLKAQIKEDLEELFRLQKLIDDQLKNMENQKHRLILTYRYVTFKSISEICDLLNYSKRMVNYMLKEALDAFYEEYLKG